jgi:hypothetical protein
MRFLLAVILFLSYCAHAQTGLLIKTVAHSNLPVPPGWGADDSTRTIYVEGARLRSEWSRPTLGPIVTIQRCDTRVMYILAPERREYMETPMPSTDETEKAGNEQKWGDGPPNLIIEATTVDTGETKSAFGHTAHRYITTTKQTPSPELGHEPSQIVEDA